MSFWSVFMLAHAHAGSACGVSNGSGLTWGRKRSHCREVSSCSSRWAVADGIGYWIYLVMSKRAFSPCFMVTTPSSHPRMSLPTPMGTTKSPRPTDESNLEKHLLAAR